MKRTLITALMLSLLIAGSLSLSAQKHLFIEDVRLVMSYTPAEWGRTELSTEQTSEVYRLNSEENLKLKDWMISPGLSTREPQMSLKELIRVDQEPPIELQKWMICCADWMKASQ